MAKIRPEQLSNYLNKGLVPVYVVSGDEPLLVQEACDTIRQAAQRQGFSERELHHTDGSFDWSNLLLSANSLSLFAEKKILEVRITNGKPGDKGSKALVEYTSSCSDENILLVVLPKLDASGQRSKWFKSLEKAGVVVQVWPIPAQQLPNWISQRLKQARLTADPEAITILADRIEGNLLAAVQEIEKLKLLVTDKHITHDTMRSAVADSARYDVFNLVEKALSGDSRAAVKTLHGLRSEGTETTIILWALSREIRTLAAVAHSLEQGQNIEWAMKNAGVWEKNKPLIRNAAKKFKYNQLQHFLRRANAIDKAIKGFSQADPWNELLDLTLNLSGIESLNVANQRLAMSVN